MPSWIRGYLLHLAHGGDIRTDPPRGDAQRHTWFKTDAVVPIVDRAAVNYDIVAAIDIPSVRVLCRVLGRRHGRDGDVPKRDVLPLVHLRDAAESSERRPERKNMGLTKLIHSGPLIIFTF